jgi:anti-sigma factor RsiW
MGSEQLHELSAAYALDALDPQEREEFELHLSTCPACREDVAAFTETAAALAYAAPPASPPARLRADILRRAAEDRPAAVVLPFRRRRVEVVLSAGLALAAAAAIVLGIWAGSLHGKLDQQRASSIIGDPRASWWPL